MARPAGWMGELVAAADTPPKLLGAGRRAPGTLPQPHPAGSPHRCVLGPRGHARAELQHGSWEAATQGWGTPGNSSPSVPDSRFPLGPDAISSLRLCLYRKSHRRSVKFDTERQGLFFRGVGTSPPVHLCPRPERVPVASVGTSQGTSVHVLRGTQGPWVIQKDRDVSSTVWDVAPSAPLSASWERPRSPGWPLNYTISDTKHHVGGGGREGGHYWK